MRMSKLSLPQTLVRCVQQGSLIPFVGSGASLAIQKGLFPTWQHIIERLREDLNKEAKETTAQIVGLMLKEGRLPDAANEAMKALGRAEFNKTMQAMFHKPPETNFDLRLQKAIWSINPKLVITTNYDSALEWSNAKASRLLNHQTGDLAGILDLNAESMPRIWHIHGHISDASSLILTPSQYQHLYEGNGDQKNYQTAKQQLTSLVGNYPLLFVGFGMNDEYVLGFIEDIFKKFESTLKKSFALLRANDLSRARLWERFNVQVIEFPDHGEPLLELVQSIANYRTNRQSLPVVESVLPVASNANINLPFAKLTSKKTKVDDVRGLISSLEDNFFFRWEKSVTPGAEQIGSAPLVVYWPIRLREPSPIHGVQAFAAAALQRYGAKIVLCLDDLGEQKFPVLNFQNRIKQWFQRVGEKSSEIDFRLFSGILKTKDPAIAWDHVQKWLGGQGYNLKTVLGICKLYSEGMDLSEFLERGTGRLLTPGVVWACLSHLLADSQQSHFMTLGGHDECNLWNAWRNKIDTGNSHVFHLYIPELSNTHMQTEPLKWHAKTDIERKIRQKLDALESKTDWNSPNEILKWSVTGCLLLPSYVQEGCKNALQVDFDTTASTHALAQAAANKIADWML
jgi:hypothetical protein